MNFVSRPNFKLLHVYCENLLLCINNILIDALASLVYICEGSADVIEQQCVDVLSKSG